MLFAAGYYRGERRPDLEREYLEDYHPGDERVARLRRLPDGKLSHITQLYTEQELKTSRSYNEFSAHCSSGRNSLNVRMDGPNGSNISWAILDPVRGSSWQSAQIRMLEHLFAPTSASSSTFVRLWPMPMAWGRPLTICSTIPALASSTSTGAARSLRANGPARDLLRRGDGLSDQGGFLGAPAAVR